MPSEPNLRIVHSIVAGACVAVSFGSAACSGDEFSEGSGGSTSHDRGATSASGSAGSGGTGAASASGSVVSAGTQGSGGAASCPCGRGYYCNDETQQCALCSDFSRFSFGAPEKQSVGPGTDQAFPRVAIDSGQERLVYVFRSETISADIGTVTGGAPWTGGSAASGTLVNGPSFDSAPLLMPEDVGFPGLSGTGLLFFDSDRSTQTRIYAVPGGVAAGPPVELPGLINSSGDNMNIAYAYKANPPRWYWVFDDSDIHLVTAVETSLTRTEVPVVDPTGCVVSGSSAAPWVTPRGDLLLFNALAYADGDCGTPSGSLRLLYVPLNVETGLPAAATAFAIDDINDAFPGASLITPSLSPDLCDLYFSAETETAVHIYLARRR
jgi:hypothetical protein